MVDGQVTYWNGKQNVQFNLNTNGKKLLNKLSEYNMTYDSSQF